MNIHITCICCCYYLCYVVVCVLCVCYVFLFGLADRRLLLEHDDGVAGDEGGHDRPVHRRVLADEVAEQPVLDAVPGRI